MQFNRRVIIFAVAAIMSVAGTASATPIAVTNFSFETTTGPATCGTACTVYSGLPGWTGTNFGGFAPGTEQGNFAYFNTLSDGVTHLFMNDLVSVASQTVAATVQAGVVYTLQIDLGLRNDVPGFKGIAALVINGNTYTATGVTPAAGGWSLFTATYIGQAADVGSAITIQLTTAGTQANFDNVRLDAASPQPVPEPATLLLLGSGLLLVASRWRSRRSNG